MCVCLNVVTYGGHSGLSCGFTPKRERERERANGGFKDLASTLASPECFSFGVEARGKKREDIYTSEVE